MKKLYQKNELLFSLIWIAIYCFISLPILSMLGVTSPVMACWLILFSAAILFFIKKNDLAEKYGLAKWKGRLRHYLFFLPMLVLMTGNLWGGIQLDHHGLGLIFAIITMILVGLVEELIFRGLLFRALLKRMPVPGAIAISAATFALGHLINLLTGQGGLDTLVQVIFALAWGFLFTFVFYRSGSLWICILSHAVIDVSSLFGRQSSRIDLIYTSVSLVVALAYGLYLSRLPSALKQKSV